MKYRTVDGTADGVLIRDRRNALERAYWHGVLAERDQNASDADARKFALDVVADEDYDWSS